MLTRACMTAALLLAPVAAAQGADTLRNLLIRYRCPVVDRLQQIYEAGDPASSRHRFLAISLPNRAQAYVQCIFHDTNRKIYCEAASGFFYRKPGETHRFHQPAKVVAALARLGFSSDDSAGNFHIDIAVADPPALNAVADFMLKALHDGYGARAQMDLQFNAPYAPHATWRCVAVS